MMSLYFMILLLALGVGVCSDESTLELGSGELESPATTLTVPTVNLIDDNGDIITSPTGQLKTITPHDEISTTADDLNTKENHGVESTTPKTDSIEDQAITEIHSQYSTDTTMALIRETTTSTTMAVVSETTTGTTISVTGESTMGTTMVISSETITQPVEDSSLETTTDTDPTMTLGEKIVKIKQTTMASMKKTTTSTATPTRKFNKTTGHTVQKPEEDERDICVFTNPDFKCFEEPVICYGEGEIECWGGEDINDTEETRATVPADYDGSTVTSDEPVVDSDVIRRRRGISYEGYTSETHYEELYKKKVDNMLDRMRNETCRLYGNIRCLPVPTHRNCVGKTFCQAVRIKSEVPSSSKPKGLETWVIVVYVISGLFGFMAIGMIIYCTIRSCKKLKVQPAHDVTPLNYITKQAEAVETA